MFRSVRDAGQGQALELQRLSSVARKDEISWSTKASLKFGWHINDFMQHPFLSCRAQANKVESKEWPNEITKVKRPSDRLVRLKLSKSGLYGPRFSVLPDKSLSCTAIDLGLNRYQWSSRPQPDLQAMLRASLLDFYIELWFGRMDQRPWY